ncbi:hypothetical protein OUZ56_007647 [Daphnia magna]|uniref:Uncharacterized protein n=1 Tax=Daphnia magna TaxID=35525 RepID=A0ABR0AAJ8_9CRUS|nr:hypothetical protein OUZ56_007647 [Daphnia magna]
MLASTLHVLRNAFSPRQTHGALLHLISRLFFFNAIYAELSECLVNKLASVIILFPFEVFGYTLLGKSNSIVPKRAHAPNLFHLDDCCSN